MSYSTATSQSETVTGSAAANNTDIIASTLCEGYGSVSVQLTGTFSATISFQGSNDNANFVAVSLSSESTPTTAPITSTTSTGLFEGVVHYKYFRVRTTAYTSGTASGTAVFKNTSVPHSNGNYVRLADGGGNTITQGQKAATASLPVIIASDQTSVPFSSDPRPSVNALYKIARLANGGATSLAVNGSVTPQNFDFAPAASETWYMTELHLTMQDSGGNSFDEFANLSGLLGGAGTLTNGLLITVKSRGTTLDYVNLKDNGDILLNADVVWIPSIAGNIGNDTATTTAIFKFDIPIKLQNSTTDFVRITVRDNISTVDFLRAAAKMWKEN